MTWALPGQDHVYRVDAQSQMRVNLELVTQGLGPFGLQCQFVLSHFSRVRLFGTLWTVARQAPLSMGFSRQEYRSG